MTKKLVVAALFTMWLAACTSMQSGSDIPPRAADVLADASVPVRTVDGVLVGPKGMTLYIFERDPADATKSTCNGQCAANWPPLKTDVVTQLGDYRVITRDDGSRQWAYKGRPLYYWAKDQKPGDRTGDGVANAWRVARP